MSFRCTLRSLFVALVGISAAHAQQFAQPTVVPTGNWPVAVYSADINGDGKPDLIYIDAGATTTASTTHILLGNGKGGFLESAVLATAGDSVGVGDFDGDGKLDIAWLSAVALPANLVTTKHFAPGNGDGTFGTVQQNDAVYTYTSSQQANDGPQVWKNLVAVQVLPTGPMDLLAEESHYKFCDDFTVLTSVGSSKCADLTQIGSGPIRVADLNRDGLPDLLIQGSSTQTVDVIMNRSGSRYQPGSYAFEAKNTWSILAHDMDGDGIPDLITEGTNGRLDIYHGNGDGTFATTSEIGTGASDGTTGNGGHLIGVTDLNGDGVPDILTSTPIGISVLLGRPPLNSHTPYIPVFTLKGIYNAGPGRSSYALADFNGDGHLDLAVDSPEGIAILFGNADGSFQTSRSYAAGLPADAVALGQSTTGGNVDAVVANGSSRLLSGDGKGGFTLAANPMPVPDHVDLGNTGWWTVATGTFESSGHLDALFIPVMATVPSPSLPPGSGGVITVTHPNPLYAYLDFGDGAGSFPKAGWMSGYVSGYASAVADFNGDGISDLASFDSLGCAVHTGPDLYFDWSQIATDTGQAPYNVGAVGFLKSGRTNKEDLVCQLSTGLQVYKNNGDGTFTQTATIPNPPGFATADSSGVFPSTGLFPSAVLLTDLDGDGYGDIIVAYHNLASDPAHPSSATKNHVYIYWGHSDGQFGSPYTEIATPQNFYQLAVADLDGPGVRDLIESDGYMLDVVSIDSVHRLGVTRHYLAGMGINSIATTTIDGKPAIIVANGGAVLTNPGVSRGTLASNAEVNTGGITVLIAGTPASTVLTGTLAADPPSVGYAQTFTLTATLVPPSNVAATGTVDFSVDGTVVGTGAVANNVATYLVQAPAYAVGTHTLTAVYSGDANYGPLTLTGSLTVTLLPTETFMDDVVTPIHYGEIIGDIAEGFVNFSSAASGSDTQLLDGGDLDFYINGQVVCVLVYASGQSQKCPATTGAGYSAGTYALSSGYLGNQYADSSHSVDYSVVVLADDTSGSLASSANPAVVGTMVTFTATFSSAFATPAGTVTFYDGATPIGTGVLNANGAATFGTSTLSIGFHDISASLAASNNFNASTTTVLRQEIDTLPIATTTLLSSNPNPSLVGQGITFTAVVASGSSVPQGTLTFTIDGLTVSTGTLNGQGVATFTSSVLGVGSHTVVASYAGTTPSTSAYFSASRSATLVQVVNVLPPPGDFTLTVTPNPIAVRLGSSLAVTVTVTALNGFNQAVALSCGNLPSEVTCGFDTDTIAAGGGLTRLTVYVSGPHSCNVSGPFYTSSGPTTWLGLLGACGLLLLVRRRRVVVLGIALCVLSAVSGCGGNCTDLGVKPGRYSFTVTGTSAGTPSVTKTVTVPMVADL